MLRRFPMKQNLHTHSIYCDGNDTLEDMIQSAIEKHFDILGFSGHGYIDYDDYAMTLEGTKQYIQEVNALKKKYAGKLQIFLGIEVDSLCRIPGKSPYDYMIGSVHCIKKDNEVFAVDDTREIFNRYLNEWYKGDFLSLARDYYASYHDLKTWEEIDIIGHLDLLTKYNEDETYIRFDDPAYVRIATDAIDDLGTDKIYEVNTGAIARGYRKTPYPAYNLLCYLKEKNARIMLSSDCHNKADLDCCFTESLELIKKAGIKTLWILTSQGFEERDIELFA